MSSELTGRRTRNIPFLAGAVGFTHGHSVPVQLQRMR
jgi:hypothetical protein